MPVITGLFTSMSNGSFEPPASLVSGDVTPYDPAAILELSTARHTDGTTSLRYKSITDTLSYYNSGALAHRRVLPLFSIKTGASVLHHQLTRFSIGWNKFVNNFAQFGGVDNGNYRIHIRAARTPFPLCVVNDNITSCMTVANNSWTANTLDVYDDGFDWDDVYISFYISYPSTNTGDAPNATDQSAISNFEIFFDKFSMLSITSAGPDPNPPPDLVVTYTKHNVSGYGGSDGQITLNVSGGTPAYSYLWENSSTSQNRTNLPAGIYTVTVHDSGGQSVILVITIKEPPYDKAWWSRNDIAFNVSAPAGWNALANPRMYDDVRSEDVTDSNNFISKFKIDLPINTDGSVVFQVREAFRNVLKADPPTFNTNQITRVTDRLKLFKHFTGFLQEDEIETANLTASKPHLVMLGGLSKLAYASIDFFNSYLPGNKKFITWAPNEKAIDRNQEDYLNWFVFDLDTTSLKLSIKGYYDDGTTQQQTTLIKDDVFCGELYVIPSGTSNSGVLGINPAKNLVRYDLNLLDQNNAIISETRTFVVDPITYPRKRLFMILNSLGSYEVLRFTGQSSYNANIDKDEIVKFLPVGYHAIDGEHEINDVTLMSSVDVSTGFIEGNYSAEWLDYMKELLMSRRVFDVTKGTRKPVTIAGGKFDVGEDQNYERYLRFTATDSYEDENYTPDL